MSVAAIMVHVDVERDCEQRVQFALALADRFQAALVGVAVLLMAGLLRLEDMVTSARIQWRPMLSLTSIMLMTGVVQEAGAFERVARMVEAHARSTSATASRRA